MKNSFFFLFSLALIAGCADTQPMPRDPYVARKIEKMDGGRGDVPSVNHPNLNPHRDDYYDDYYGGSYYNRHGRAYYPARSGGYYYR
jgi:hypothetical protein